MEIVKSFEYRIYPTAQQKQTLIEWQNALRFLWNLANEQYILNRNRLNGHRVKVNLYTQDKELTDLRNELEWLKKVPRHLCTSILVQLDIAWQRYFNQISGRPKFKYKSKTVCLKEYDYAPYCRGRQLIIFPRLGKISAKIHRPFEGSPKTCTIKNDGDRWFAFVVSRINVPDPISKLEPCIGIDRGLINLIADSSGSIIANPKYLERVSGQICRAQRKLSSKKKGSKNWLKFKNRLSRKYRKVRRKRKHFLHVQSTHYAKNQGIVAIEKLMVQNLDRNRKAKGILDAGWGIFAQMLKYKLEWSGGRLIEVPAAYSSQTCSCCGHVDKNSRKDQQFCCVKCGYTDHADVNAAKIILSRMNRSAQPVDGDLKCQTGRSRKVHSTKALSG